MRSFTFALAAVFALWNCHAALAAPAGFVVRCDNQLCLDGKVFRFASFNTPELMMRQDPYWDVAAAFDQEDLVRTVATTGGRVARTYVLSIAGTGHDPVHVEGPGQYGEEAFVALDRALALANRYGIKLIIPFIDSADWWGGVPQFAAMYGATAENFYTSDAAREGYRDLVSYVLNRRNTITGIVYKDDPAVLAWETGNELRQAPTAWTIEMAAYLKSIDPNHLVLDGNDDEHDKAVLDDPNIDFLTRHYYGAQFKLRLANDLDFAEGRKPTIVGEFGGATLREFKQLLAAVEKSRSPGALLWMLGNHDSGGGWRWRCAPSTGCSYHWPGFAFGDAYDETAVLKLVADTAARLSGEALPVALVPDVPTMLPVETPLDIRWLGVVGAETYDVEKSADGGATWTALAENVDDSAFDLARRVYRPVIDAQNGRFHDGALTSVALQDLAAKAGDRLQYRVRARGAGGVSDWSDPVAATIAISTGLVMVPETELAGMGERTRFAVPTNLKRIEITTDAGARAKASCLPSVFGADGLTPLPLTSIPQGKAGTILLSGDGVGGTAFEVEQPCRERVKILALRYAFGTYDLASVAP